MECYKRHECSVEEALIERHLAGVSVRHIEDIIEALWESIVLKAIHAQESKGGPFFNE